MRGNDKRGFSLLELVVIIAVLAVGLLSLITVLNTSIQLSRESPNQLKAVMLASEAITHIENIRDSNILNGVAWNNQLSTCYGKTCIVGYKNSCFNCNGGQSFTCQSDPLQLIGISLVPDRKVVHYNANASIPSLRYYQVRTPPASGCFNSDATMFNRTITIQEMVPEKQARVTVTVTWTDTRPHTFSMSSDLYNWQ